VKVEASAKEDKRQNCYKVFLSVKIKKIPVKQDYVLLEQYKQLNIILKCDIMIVVARKPAPIENRP